MSIGIWQLWLLAAVVFFILEMFTPSFFMACIAIGCTAGGLAALFGGEVVAQLLFFSLATLVAFVGVRPLALRYLYKKSETVRTNVDSLAGRSARVSERIDPATGQGRVVVDGDDWKAASENNTAIEKGEQVEIVKVDSVILVVKKV
ncbi:MAG: NfeD family protein [Prevotellaceae bacterium]|jgi:membrane protein implicated in regulation of membrane protease activity|nr:NfeD family protein [Prevotellaceae bacterium]